MLDLGRGNTATPKKDKKMAKAKNVVVTITAPKIVTAWQNIAEVGSTNEANAIKAINELVKAMTASKLSIRDIQKVIKETKIETSILKVSHVEGLPTWSAMREKFADFKALPLAKQLSKATAGYKLGAGVVEKMSSLEVVDKEIKDFNSRKNSNSKKSSKPTKEKKATTNAEVLSGFLNFLGALNAEALTDAELDLMADISLKLIELEPVA
jgi:hypothetical protein